MVRITDPHIGAILSVQTREQQEFLQMDRKDVEAKGVHWLDIKRQDTADLSFSNRIAITWEPQLEGILQLSENADLSDAVLTAGTGSCEITNLKVGTRYYIRVVSGEKRSEISYFDTADVCPRCLWVEGITNVRDCGGWKTVDGKRVRQGLLYRGSEMNSHVTVTPAGLQTLRRCLKLRSVLDLRGDTETVENVYGGNYLNIPCKGYVQYLDDLKSQRQIFEFLAAEENYPVYFHCWGGADRTASVAFILGALLGMSEKDLLDDYEITSLSIWGVRSRNTDLFRSFRERLEQLEGVTLREKVESFLRSCGVTDAQMEKFRGIMLM